MDTFNEQTSWKHWVNKQQQQQQKHTLPSQEQQFSQAPVEAEQDQKHLRIAV